MKLFKILLLLPFIVFSDADDMYVIKGGMTFLPDGSFAKKDILVDEGQIILVADTIGDVGAENIIDAEGKYVTPGLIVFSSLGLLEIGALPQTNDTSSDIITFFSLLSLIILSPINLIFSINAFSPKSI